MKFQYNLRHWIGIVEFDRCMYKSRWKLPYHIHYEWDSGRQGYVGQEAIKCRDKKCKTKEWKFRRSINIIRLIDKLNTPKKATKKKVKKDK